MDSGRLSVAIGRLALRRNGLGFVSGNRANGNSKDRAMMSRAARAGRGGGVGETVDLPCWEPGSGRAAGGTRDAGWLTQDSSTAQFTDRDTNALLAPLAWSERRRLHERAPVAGGAA